MQTSLFDFAEDEDPLENEQDLSGSDFDQVRGISTFTTDWTVETILAQIDKGNILLDPRWQRRDAWNISRKSDLIESVILNYPVPPIVLAEQKGQRGKYIVIDGKQRLLSLRQFAASSLDKNFKNFKLSELPTLGRLRGFTYADMRDDPKMRMFVDQFENYPIRTVIVRGWDKESVLYSIFLRLNAGSAKLYPQELRQALHPGPFIDFIDDFAIGSREIQSILGNRGPDFRMRDNELALRYFAFRNFISVYDGNLKLFLDYTVFDLNAKWAEWQHHIESQSRDFAAAYYFSTNVFNDGNPFKKFGRNGYENRLNRAVFDIMMFSFSSGEIRDKLAGKEAMLREAYENLCRDDVEFLSSLETTTKSVPATRKRFFSWASAVNRILGYQALNPHVSGQNLADAVA